MIIRIKIIITKLAAKIAVVLASPAKHQAEFFIFLSAAIVLLSILILMITLAYFLLVPPKYEVGVIQPTDRKRITRRFKIKVALLSFFAIVTVAGLAAGDIKTMESSFCRSCHFVRKEYRSWKRGSHKTVECKKCHANGGITGFFSTKIRQAENLYGFIVYPNDLNFDSSIRNSECLECHGSSMSDNLPSRGGFSMNHKGLVEGGLLCVDCHSGVGHQTKRSPKPVAEMSLCLECHNANIAPDTCESCHAGSQVKIRNDKLDVYKVPVLAMNSCADCHRKELNCTRCHFGFELPHPPAFISGEHKSYPAAKCFKCHTQGTAYCTQCHTVPTSPATTP